MLRKSSVWLVVLLVAVAFIATGCLRLVVNGTKSPVKEEAKPEVAKETEKSKMENSRLTEVVPVKKPKEEVKEVAKKGAKGPKVSEMIALKEKDGKGFTEENIGEPGKPTGLKIIKVNLEGQQEAKETKEGTKVPEIAPKQEVMVYSPTEEAKVPEKALKQEAKLEKTPVPLDLAGMRIQFAFDDYCLSTQARETLNKIADWMKKDPKVRVLIGGHTCEIGTEEYNLALGEQRARSAGRYLETLGVSPGRIILTSYGPEKPLDPGHTEEARSKNRRDEFVETR